MRAAARMREGVYDMNHERRSGWAFKNRGGRCTMIEMEKEKIWKEKCDRLDRM
jgi:hypothetical protein